MFLYRGRPVLNVEVLGIAVRVDQREKFSSYIGEMCYGVSTCTVHLETLEPHSFLNNSTNTHRRPLKPFVMCF